MAGDALTFIWELLDKGSGPAKKIASGLGGIDDAMAKVNASSHKTGNGLDHLTAPAKLSAFQKLSQGIGNTFGPKAHAAFTGAAEGLAGLDDALGSVGLSLGGVVGAAVTAGAAVVAVGAGLVLGGSKLAIGAADFRDNAILSLEALLGSADAASTAYEDILDAADRVGLDKADALSRFQVLINKGLGKGQALGALEAIANLKALGEAGGKEGKKFIKELNDAIEKGAPGAVDAVLDKINKSKIGKLAEKQGATIGRLWGDVGGNFARLFDKVDISPLKDFLGNVIDGLKDPALKSAITEGFGAVFSIFKNITKEDVASAVKLATGAIQGMVDVTKALVHYGGKLGDAFDSFATATGWKLLFTDFELGGKKMSAVSLVAKSALDILGGSFKVLGAAILYTLDPVGSIKSAVTSIVPTLYNTGIEVGVFFAGLPSKAWEAAGAFAAAGANMMTSLASGITGSATAVMEAVINATSNAIKAAKKILGIASPSKVFAGLGEFTSIGFADGIANDTSPVKAAADMGASVVDAAAGEAGAAGGVAAAAAAASSGGGRIDVGGIVIEIHGVSGAPGDIEREVRNGIDAALERLAAAG